MADAATTAERDDVPDFDNLTRDQCVALIRSIYEEMEDIEGRQNVTESHEVRFAELTDWMEKANERRKTLERASEKERARQIRESLTTSTGPVHFEREGSFGNRRDYDRDPIANPDSIEESRFGNPWDLSEVRTYAMSPEAVSTELRSRAKCAIEKMAGASQDIREAATSLLNNCADNPTALARQILVTSSPTYLRAFNKCISSKEHLLTNEERTALSLTGANGGYMVPFQLDPTVIITSAGSFNEVRKIARVVNVTGPAWHGVSASEAAFSWDAEAEQVSDDGPSDFAQPTVNVHNLRGYVTASFELQDDGVNTSQQIASILASGKETKEAIAFATGAGDGSNEPYGVITAVSATSGSLITPATAETFAAADIYNMDNGLPAKHRFKASWLANRKVYNLVRQFDTAGGAQMWERIGNGMPAELLGQGAYEAEAMDATWDVTATAHNYILAYGDFSNYVIADRIGTTLHFVPIVFGANQRPTGQSGWFATYRVGADSVNDDAFRVFDLVTAA